MSKRISLIVPVHNAQSYLPQCLDSLMGQSYPDYELILVDDGSTDESGRICDEYQAKYKACVISLHQANHGPGAARNAGIKRARGDWIVFADSDDTVRSTYLSDLWELATGTGADIGVTGFVRVSRTSDTDGVNSRLHDKAATLEAPDGSIAVKAVDTKDRRAGQKLQIRDATGTQGNTTDASAEGFPAKIFSPDEAICNMWYQKGISNFPWGKIYRRELFDDTLFPEDTLYEDLAVLYLLFSKADKIAWRPLEDYYYHIREGSIMTSAYHDGKMDRVRVSRQLLNWSAAQSMAVQAAAKERFFLSNVQVLREIPMTKEYTQQVSLLWRNICRYRGEVLRNPEVRISNRLIALSSYLGLRTLKWLGGQYTRLHK